MTDDRMKRVRHEYGSRGGGDYVQNVAEFDLALAEHDREVEARGLEAFALTIRDALDEWEASGDGEKLVNEVIDPLLIDVLARAQQVREGKA